MKKISTLILMLLFGIGNVWAIDAPQIGHFYRIKSYYKGTYLAPERATSNVDNSTLCYYSKNGLIQVSSGKYYYYNSNKSGFDVESTSHSNVVFQDNASVNGTFSLGIETYYAYCGANNWIWGSTNPTEHWEGWEKWYGDRFAWYVEEVEILDYENAGKVGYHTVEANNALREALNGDPTQLASAIETFKASAIVMPEVGKKYAFRGITSKNNYLIGSNSTVNGYTDRIAVSQTVSYPDYFFTLQQGNKLQASNGNYVINNSSGMLKLGDGSQSDAVEITFVPATTSGTFFLKYMHGTETRYAYSDRDEYIDGGGTTDGNLGYEWKIEELVMPESGKAYRVKNVQKDGTVYYLCNTENNLGLTSDASSANTTFIFREVGDFDCSGTTRGKKYAVVNEYGKYLAYRAGTNAAEYAQTGYSNSYVEDKTFWAFAKIGTRTNASLGNITADDSFGRLCIGCYRSDAQQTGEYGFIVIKKGGTFDTAGNTTVGTGTFFNDNFSSLFELEEITDYTANQVSLKAPKKTDGKTYSSIYLPYPVKVPADVTAYYCTLSGNALHLNEMGNKIPARTGAILIGGTEASTQILVPATTETTSQNVEKNVLSGVLSNTLTSTLGSKIYVLNGGQSAGIGFYPYSQSATLTAYKAYYNASAQGARDFYLFGSDDSATGIEDLLETADNKNETFANGRKVLSHDGRIVIVKEGKKYSVTGQIYK